MNNIFDLIKSNVNYILLKNLGIPTFSIIACFSIVGFLGAVIVRFALHVLSFDIIIWNNIIPDTPLSWCILMAVGVLSFLGQIMLITACKIENAGLVSLIRKSFDVSFSFLIQISVFGVSFDLPPRFEMHFDLFCQVR